MIRDPVTQIGQSNKKSNKKVGRRSQARKEAKKKAKKTIVTSSMQVPPKKFIPAFRRTVKLWCDGSFKLLHF